MIWYCIPPLKEVLKDTKTIQKMAKGSQMKVLFPFLILSLVFVYISLIDCTEGSPKHYCLRHCHMCNEMYGRHFMIHLCKDDCMESRGRLIPDCLDLNSIKDYLILTDWFWSVMRIPSFSIIFTWFETKFIQVLSNLN